jgi:Na+/proline symporter
MSQDTEPNELLEIAKGFLLLLLFHILAIVIMAALVTIINSFLVLVIGAMGFLFWQLLYVIPLALWLRSENRPGVMKGVIIGAVLTALLNGVCYISSGLIR